MFRSMSLKGAAARAAIVAIAAFVAVFSLSGHTRALPTDDIGDTVFGQPNMSTSGCNTGGISATSLCRPQWMAFDSSGNLYVVDAVNSRILVYDNAAGSGDTIADYVIGQPDFTTSGCPAPTASSLCYVAGVAFDLMGNLWVSDWGNNRVLRYANPRTTDAVADGVIGQPNFTSNACGGPTATTVCNPFGIAVDQSNSNVFVADMAHHRVVEFDSPTASDATADHVYGQPNFTSGACNGFLLSATSMCVPAGVEIRPGGSLFVADSSNNRVLQYDTPLSDSTADAVYGQPNFTTNACNSGGLNASSLCAPWDVAFETATTMYIADRSNRRVLRYDSTPSFDATADGVYGQGGSFTTNTCAPVSAASICYPYGLIVDPSSRLLVSDAISPEAGPPSDRERVLRLDGCPLGDADCDGFQDVAPTAHQGPANTNIAFDNCPTLTNITQANADGNFIELGPSKGYDDLTRPMSDALGDACDVDADSDRRPDADELTGFGCAGIVTSPTNPDMDGDLFLDGAECYLGFSPTNFASRPTIANCTAVAPGDADADGLSYAREFCFYGTDDTLANSDGDACSDAKEVATINANLTVDAIDLGQVAQAFGLYTAPNYIADFDFTRDLSINAIDLGQVAQRFGPC